jgi:hypothetical protein
MSKWPGVVGFHHETECQSCVMHEFSGRISACGGLVTPGRITIGWPNWIVLPSGKIKHTTINHRVSPLGLNWMWDGKAASFVAPKKEGNFDVWEGR